MTHDQQPDSAASDSLNAALHDLNRHVRVSAADGETMRRVESLVREASALLEPHDFPGPYCQSELNAERILGFGSSVMRDRPPEEVMAYSPFIGRRNPISPRIRMYREGNCMMGAGVFPALMAGPPNTVHGGIIAGVMDELLGGVLWLNNQAGFTGTLEVRYNKPTPLLEEITMRGEYVRSEGRKNYARGVFMHRGEVTAVANGVFIGPRT